MGRSFAATVSPQGGVSPMSPRRLPTGSFGPPGRVPVTELLRLIYGASVTLPPHLGHGDITATWTRRSRPRQKSNPLGLRTQEEGRGRNQPSTGSRSLCSTKVTGGRAHGQSPPLPSGECSPGKRSHSACRTASSVAMFCRSGFGNHAISDSTSF